MSKTTKNEVPFQEVIGEISDAQSLFQDFLDLGYSEKDATIAVNNVINYDNI